jgi:hypothetical protein
MEAATSLQVSAALAGEVARVVSIVLSLSNRLLTSQVVAPDCSKALQISCAYSWALGSLGGGSVAVVAGRMEGAGVDGVGAVVTALEGGRAMGLPSAPMAFTAPFGHAPNC